MSQDKQLDSLENTKVMKTDSYQSGSSHSKRLFIFVLTGLLIIALPILVYKLVHDWRYLKTLQAELSSVKKQSSDLAILKNRIDSWKDYHSQLKQLMDDSNQSELGEDFWIERKVAINRRQINRTEASGFLEGVGRDQRSFFKTNMFEIQTVQSGDDLYKFRQGDANEVQLTMDGVFFTKIKQ
ncbi:MAG: hypothetical protein AB8B80_01320 [Marinicellaceae bacterium]